MCGIAGFLGTCSAGATREIAGAMSRSLEHRGPDDDGIWIDTEAGVSLIHRRLSIVDLSPAGHQPMVSANGRFVISYNGEVYSFPEIRKDLEARGVKFYGCSDTEVMLESIALDGLEATLQRLIGMFAIALWDRRERIFTLVRDRLGIKPVYWAKFGELFLFGSELKALRAHPGWTPRIDQAAVSAFMRHNYIPAPHSIYHNVHKLEPGTILVLPWHGEPHITHFWDARAMAREGRQRPLAGNDAELTERLEGLLQDAVRRRMIADVPLGAFLSGGIDSTTVVALMRSVNPGKVRTFTIGFAESEHDEAPHAAAVARHLGTEHTELTLTPQQTLDVIPFLPEWFDEPFADSSQIPTHLVSVMTRRHVTVALSGDGGDELFGGYNRYQLATRSWHTLMLLPLPVRSVLARSVMALPPDRWTRLLTGIGAVPANAQIGDRLYKAASVLAQRNPDAAYRQLITHWDPAAVAPATAEPRSILADDRMAEEFPDLLSRMQFLDLVTYLPDDILTKLDRASMAVALEARVPLLDHRVVEYAWSLPPEMKIRDRETKWVLRRILDRHVPPKLMLRPKMGFGIPLAAWLRGPLRDWAEHLLSERRLSEAGLLDATLVRRYWREHLDGRHNWQNQIWDVLMLEAWRERWNMAPAVTTAVQSVSASAGASI